MRFMCFTQHFLYLIVFSTPSPWKSSVSFHVCVWVPKARQMTLSFVKWCLLMIKRGHILFCVDLTIRDNICQENSWWYCLNDFTLTRDRLKAKSLPESKNKQWQIQAGLWRTKLFWNGIFSFGGCDQEYAVLSVRSSGNFKPHMWIRVI